MAEYGKPAKTFAQRKLEQLERKRAEKEAWQEQMKMVKVMIEADRIEIISGEVKGNHCLAFHKARKEFHIQHRKPTVRPKHLVNGAFENWQIIGREDASKVTIEEIGSDQKKDIMTAAATGIAMGFLLGGAGLLAGSTSGNYKKMLFKLRSQSLGEFICEANYDLYKVILVSSMEYSWINLLDRAGKLDSCRIKAMQDPQGQSRGALMLSLSISRQNLTHRSPRQQWRGFIALIHLKASNLPDFI